MGAPFPGAVVSRVATLNLASVDESEALRNDEAHLAELAWHTLVGDSEMVSAAALGDHLAKSTRGGRNVTALGLIADILAAATIDRFDFVPELHLKEWRIVR